ncbi:MAG: 16S rRNA (adenine(1518)-N(6)/adenine(1519)-N(6))-dimethyltransferase RsmA [Patescibacteria group bacterium]
MKHSEILAHYNITAKKSLGQNFLVQDGILDKIAEVSEITGKNVIEVGPGYGALTQKLLDGHPKKLTLIEFDSNMVRILHDRIKQGTLVVPAGTELEIREQDVLTYDLTEEAVMIANIPYYITSPILFRFLYETTVRPSEMVILMQREVGDKIRCVNGFKSSYFSLYCTNACSVISEIMRVAPGNFIPAPKVESSVLHFVTSEKAESKSDKRFLKVLSVGFLHPRKFLASNLVSGNIGVTKEQVTACFESLGLSLQVRPGELTMSNWKDLAKAIDTIRAE